uniref:Uncharacterized protein n=1 Tax=Onchocerca volvulus TaxID=6282 RepID=A0A8R1TUB9_ONCVO
MTTRPTLNSQVTRNLLTTRILNSGDGRSGSTRFSERAVRRWSRVKQGWICKILPRSLIWPGSNEFEPDSQEEHHID